MNDNTSNLHTEHVPILEHPASSQRRVGALASLLKRLASLPHAERTTSDLTALDPGTWNDIGLPPVPRSHVPWALA